MRILGRSWRHGARVGVVALVLLASIAALGPQPASAGYVQSNGIKFSSIPVCWNQGGHAVDKELVQKTIRETWQFVSNVSFVNWGRCRAYDPNEKILRIEIDDVRPVAPAHGGPKSLTEEIGVVLNFTFAIEGPFCATDALIRERCIQADAVHEFGHVLGFHHEQNRDDTPATCTAPKDSYGTTKFGQWDLLSIMNYCNPLYFVPGAELLSGTDIQMVQAYYGRPAWWPTDLTPSSPLAGPSYRAAAQQLIPIYNGRFEATKALTRGEAAEMLYRSLGRPPVAGRTATFADVPTSHANYTAVAWAYGAGVVNGTSSTSYEPNRSVTRGEFVTMLHRLAGNPAPISGVSFPDVVPTAYYALPVGWAASIGITVGSNGLFHPVDPVNRAEAATFVFRSRQVVALGTVVAGT